MAVGLGKQDKAGYSTQAKQEYVSFMVLLFFSMNILSPWFMFYFFLATMLSPHHVVCVYAFIFFIGFFFFSSSVLMVFGFWVVFVF